MTRITRVWLVLVLFFPACLAYSATSEPATKPSEKSASKTAESDYELYKILVDTIDQVERNYVTEVNRRELIEAAIRGVLNKLDPYSSYIAPDDLDRFRTSVESEFGGIGIQITADEGQLQILSPMYGTPAYRAGLLAGDRILEIDGKSTDGLTLDDAVGRLKGDEGTSVTLTVVHPGKEAKEKAYQQVAAGLQLSRATVALYEGSFFSASSRLGLSPACAVCAYPTANPAATNHAARTPTVVFMFYPFSA